MPGQNSSSDILFTGLGSDPSISGERAADHHPSHKYTQDPSLAESSDDLSFHQRVQNASGSLTHEISTVGFDHHRCSDV